MANNQILVIWLTAQSQSASMACYGACLKWMLPGLSSANRWSGEGGSGNKIRDIEDAGWDMSIPLKLYQVSDGNADLRMIPFTSLIKEFCKGALCMCQYVLSVEVPKEK